MDIRSFLAFELAPELKEVISGVSAQLRKSRLDARWVRPEGIHLTVVFLGEVAKEDLEAMNDPIRGVCASYAPFSVALKGVGCFPNVRKPRVIWLGLEGDRERMARFRDELQRALSPFGIEPERRAFAAHLTLGRFRNPVRSDGELDRYLGQYAEIKGPACTLRELILFRSDLKPAGAEYTGLGSFPLTGTA
jgi:2'-5' RNA ligase